MRNVFKKSIEEIFHKCHLSSITWHPADDPRVPHDAPLDKDVLDMARIGTLTSLHLINERGKI